MNALTKQTTGTMTAKSEGEADFEANTGFSIRHSTPRWEIHADYKASTGDPRDNRFFSFYFPCSPPDTDFEDQYPLSSSDDPEKALAYYGSQDFYMPSTEGKLTITYTAIDQKMTGSFNLKCNSGQEKFILSEGKFDLTGIMEAKANPDQTFTADLKGGLSEKFEADPGSVSLSYIEDKKQYGFGASQLVWGLKPQGLHRVTLFISDQLKKGTHLFKMDDTKIRATYFDTGGQIYRANEGSLVLKADPSVNKLEATLEFTAIAFGIEPEEKIILSNGEIHYLASPPK